MFLSRLEIVGFKSFPERTEVRFGPGVTGIVGPNGCGKTNILDSIRWVMGEQRPTLLRGGKMEEVIFNGAPGVAPVGMAEVSLTVENNRGILPVEYSEVVVTRRLFRSGESEYMLNRVPCRLKDIVELFLDTGMGSHAYAVFQQSMIDALLSEKPEDRLGLFEEAAGVAKYKHRRKAAQRKLEAADTDLVRLNDLFSEVEKQYNSLKRQVKKAEKFKNLEEEKKALKFNLASHEYRELKGGEEKAGLAVRALEIEVAEVAAQKRKLELEKENLSLKLIEKETEKKRLDQELSGFMRQGLELEGRRALLLVENESFAERKEELETELARLKERSEAIAEEIDNLSKQKEKLAVSKSKLKSAMAGAEAELTLFSGRFEELSAKKAELLSRQEQARQRRTELESERKVWESRAEEVSIALAELVTEAGKFEFELGNKKEEKVQVEKELAGVGRKLNEVSEKFGILDKNLAEISSQKEALSVELQSLENQASELEGRRAILEDLEKNYGGYEPATKEILSRKEEFPGIVDSLANLISAEERYLGLIEAALGERAQAVVATSWEEVRRTSEFLKEKNLGRARFLILRSEEVVQPEAESWPGAVAWASDLVWGEDATLTLVRQALKNVLVVENREAAFRLAVRAGENVTLVTLDAEVFGPGGYFAAGLASGAFLVGRKAELNRVREKLAEVGQRKAHLTEIFGNFSSKLNSSKLELEQLITQRSELAAKETDIRFTFERLALEEATVADKITGLNKNRDEFLSRQTDAREGIARLTAQLATLGGKESGRTSTLAVLEQEEQTLGRGEREKQEILTKNRMELVSALAHLEATDKDLARLADEREQAEEISKEKHRKLSELLDLHENFDERLSGIGTEEEKVKGSQGSVETVKEKLAKEISEFFSAVSFGEKSLKEVVGKLEEVAGRKHEKQLLETDWRARKESLSGRFYEDYHQTLEILPPAGPSVETTVENLKARLEEIEKSMANLGAVNLEALSEYPTCAERYEFMNKQIEDLTKAKEELSATIVQINGNAQELFAQTFEVARDNFKNLFAELFEGGQADLILEPAEDPLEPDLRIVARPKGKKLVTIQQLSGGEKALTAIALLFALYMVKPSPFCILDEIDAPLDDANVDRFLSIIRKFSSGETQFIVITHNKRTMEAADVLYGVTMEKTGISKMVSVRLEGQPVAVLQEREVPELAH